MTSLEQKYRFQQVEAMITKFGSSEQLHIVKEHLLLSREKLCGGLCLIEPVLLTMKSFLTDPIWYGAPPANTIISVDDSQEFHRLWSALQFVFCMPARSQHEYTIEQLFGEGLNWAGCTLITLLGQRSRFENLDFCYHLLKVNRIDQKDEDIKGITLKKMVDRVRKFQILNMQIFSVLDKYLGDPSSPDMEVRHLEPPSLLIDHEFDED